MQTHANHASCRCTAAITKQSLGPGVLQLQLVGKRYCIACVAIEGMLQIQQHAIKKLRRYARVAVPTSRADQGFCSGCSPAPAHLQKVKVNASEFSEFMDNKLFVAGASLNP